MKSIAFVFALFLALTASSQKYELRLNLEKGKAYQQVTAASVSVLQDMDGQKLTTDITIGGTISFLVKDITDGNYDMEVKYLSLSMNMKMPTHSIEADSEHPDNTNAFSLMLSSFINKSFSMTMTKKGEIEKITGVEALFDGMFDKLPSLSKEEKDNIRLQLSDAFGERSLRTSIENAMAFFPDNKVSMGESWNKIGRIESGMKANYNTTYQLKESKEGYHLIEGSASITTEKDPVKLSIYSYVYDMSGTLTSHIKIDAKSGWIIEVKTTQELKGTMGMSLDNGSEKMVIPMSMTSQSIIKNK